MGYPKNPETLIIKNEFYPSGLKEIDIWNYYQNIKSLLLKETLGKPQIVYFAVDTNKLIIRRKLRNGSLIRLTPSTWDTIVSGRSLSFVSVMERYSDYGIIDIDTDDFKLAKEATIYIYDLLNKARFVKDLEIRFTGKRSFHIKVDFGDNYKIEYIKKTLNDYFIENKVDNKYSISKQSPINNIPNIDLNRNVLNAGYISLHSLSNIGLKCMIVNRRFINNFRKETAKIKK